MIILITSSFRNLGHPHSAASGFHLHQFQVIHFVAVDKKKRRQKKKEEVSEPFYGLLFIHSGFRIPDSGFSIPDNGSFSSDSFYCGRRSNSLPASISAA